MSITILILIKIHWYVKMNYLLKKNMDHKFEKYI